MDEARIRLAEELLREGVYRSRARQSAPLVPRTGNCGLGEGAKIVLELSPRGRECFDELFASGLDPRATERFHATLSGWIEQQDALDRKRNHFLKSFRNRHGFDRTKYTPEILADYDAGLAGIAEEENGARRRAAEELAKS